ncbi:FHA domain-containing protein [Paenibacillus sonchi]|uniref:FHA domain-containing protein n=1 Tax=Paenibacillus sonchi TaxID=373687 RepID=A0A974SFN2_9BACL|nr:FHA domain-containing protein [Paenibacillus sonchi]
MCGEVRRSFESACGDPQKRGGYILKDLDSRNGTLFQGEAMIPYKEYPLTEGAVFTIVKGCYTFRSA